MYTYKKLTFPDYETLSKEVASSIFKKVTSKLNANERFVLGMATGSTPLGVYESLLEFFHDYTGDLKEFYTVNLDEYFPIEKNNPHSYYHYMMSRFWGPLSKHNNTFNWKTNALIPDGSAMDPHIECISYENRINEIGGIDLQILGIGVNGHIGFNEPGSSEHSVTRLVDLEQQTIDSNKKYFNDKIALMPRQAITMGIKTILEANEIYLLASGNNKIPVMQKLAKMQSSSSDLPASFLLNHPHVSVFTDISDISNI